MGGQGAFKASHVIGTATTVSTNALFRVNYKTEIKPSGKTVTRISRGSAKPSSVGGGGWKIRIFLVGPCPYL